MKKGITPLLWTLVLLNVVLTLVNAVFPNHIPVLLLILMPLAFALLHGAQRYKWSGIITLLVMGLVVSNLLENTSILTSFPFGHYYLRIPAELRNEMSTSCQKPYRKSRNIPR